MNSEYSSRYPKFWRKTPRSRTLAIGIPLYNEQEEHIGYKIMGEDGQTCEVSNQIQLRSTLQGWNCDLFLSRLYGHGGFFWLAECLRDRRAEVLVSSASQSIVQISIKVGRSCYHIVSSGAWSYGTTASPQFMEALRHVFVALEIGTYSSPGSLGHALFQHFMQQEQQGRKTRRPPAMLYERLYEYGTGGRAEDFSTKDEYERVFEIDRSNAYGQTILEHGVPLCEDMETRGTTDVYDSELRDYTRYATAYCQATITIPRGLPHHISPFVIRMDTGGLEYPTEPGTYRGYYWLETLRRAEACGYRIRIAFAYCWTRTSDILKSTIEKLIQVRDNFKQQKKEKEEALAKATSGEERRKLRKEIEILGLAADMIKQVIVSFIGRFGMHQEKLSLILEEDASEEDEPFLNLQAIQCEGLRTPFYLHREQQGNEPHLVQIAQYVINWNNLELFDRQIAEEEVKNKVIATNFDAIFLKKPSRLPMDGWKQLTHTQFRPLGKRSYESYVDGKKRRRRPGVKR